MLPELARVAIFGDAERGQLREPFDMAHTIAVTRGCACTTPTADIFRTSCNLYIIRQVSKVAVAGAPSHPILLDILPRILLFLEPARHTPAPGPRIASYGIAILRLHLGGPLLLAIYS